MKLGRTLLTIGATVGGFVAGGPAGAATGYALSSGVNSQHESNQQGRRAMAAQEEQSGYLKARQQRLDAQLSSEKRKADRSLFRLGKSRVKGGLFGSFPDDTLGSGATTGTLG